MSAEKDAARAIQALYADADFASDQKEEAILWELSALYILGADVQRRLMAIINTVNVSDDASCKYCGMSGLKWMRVDRMNTNRLIEPNGAIHTCKEFIERHKA